MTQRQKDEIHTIGVYKPYNSSLLKAGFFFAPEVLIQAKPCYSAVASFFNSFELANQRDAMNKMQSVVDDKKLNFISSISLMVYAGHNLYKSYAQKDSLEKNYSRKLIIETDDGQLQKKIVEPILPIVSSFDFYNTLLLAYGITKITNLIFSQHVNTSGNNNDIFEKISTYSFYGAVAAKVFHVLVSEDVEALEGRVKFEDFNFNDEYSAAYPQLSHFSGDEDLSTHDTTIDMFNQTDGEMCHFL